MSLRKTFLILLLIQSIKGSETKCKIGLLKDTFSWSHYKEIVKNYGSINFVFAYNFLKGSNATFLDFTHEWILSNKNIIFHDFILLIKPYHYDNNFMIRFSENFTFETDVSRMRPLQVPVNINIPEKLYKDKSCSTKVSGTIWRISYKEKYCIIFYSCHVQFKNFRYLTTNQIILMLESPINLNEIKDIDFDANEYEGKFKKFDNIEGSDFCMCKNINKTFNEETDKNYESTIFIAWQAIGISFILVAGILFLIYEFLTKENVLFKKSNNIAIAARGVTLAIKNLTAFLQLKGNCS